MFVHKDRIPVKPYLSWTFVQGAEERTLRLHGHTSMQAAKRAAVKSMRELRRIEGETGPVLMSWGYQEITDSDRLIGTVL